MFKFWNVKEKIIYIKDRLKVLDFFFGVADIVFHFLSLFIKDYLNFHEDDICIV